MQIMTTSAGSSVHLQKYEPLANHNILLLPVTVTDLMVLINSLTHSLRETTTHHCNPTTLSIWAAVEFYGLKTLVIGPTVHNQSIAWPTNYMGQQQIGLNNNILRAWPMMWTSDGGGADGCGDGWWLDKFECVHDKLFYRLQWIELLSIVCTTIPHSDQILVNVDPRIRLCLQGIQWMNTCAEWNCVTFPRMVRSSCCIVYE